MCIRDRNGALCECDIDCFNQINSGNSNVRRNFIQGFSWKKVYQFLFWEIIRNIVGITAIVLLTGTIGYLMGYINEKVGNGSIIPSWIIHSSANIMTSFLFIKI